MKKLKRSFPELENVLFKSYDNLSDAGFEILIEEGCMIVFQSQNSIELDNKEGLVIVANDEMDNFMERQFETK